MATVASPFRPDALNDPCSRMHIWSLHAGGGNFLIGDGSVRYLTYAAAPTLYAAIAIADGVGLVDQP